MTRIGSLCSGYGGLEMGVQSVVGSTVAWHSDIDPGASKILAHHWPNVPNHGDLTTTDWSTVEPVDIITAGWPCQPWSLAGKGKGAQDERAIWPAIADAVRHLRPRHVILENVAAIIVLGELARSVGDLASLGYVGSWRCLRASDVGAPHGRNRCFVVATDTARIGHQRAGQSRDGWAGPADSGDAAPDADCATGPVTGGIAPGSPQGAASEAFRGAGRSGGAPATYTTGDGRDEGWPEPAGQLGRPDAAERGGSPAPNPEVAERRGPKQQDMGASTGPAAEPRERLGSATYWGQYEPAIRRWEHVLGRCAPAPTELGRTGNPRLSPRFVEFLMGLPEGHITDVPGLTRNEQLKALGNGVVAQQAAAALRMLLNLEEVAA